ncbi:hypothetical protein [Ferruginibacter sp.]
MSTINISKIIASAAVLIMLVSCGAKNAQEFNNKLVGAQRSLMSEVNKAKTDSMDALAKLKHIQDITKTKLKEINDLKTPEGGEGFKDAMVKDFEGIVDTYDILIKMVEKKDDATEVEALKIKLDEKQVKIEDLDQKVIDEQKKFADKYHIKLQ